MELSSDFSQFVDVLNKHDGRYPVVGGYTVEYHGHPRYTKGLDIWLMINRHNADKVVAALEEFGFGELSLSEEDFLGPGYVIQLGRPPTRTDRLTRVDGLDFDVSYEEREELTLGTSTIPVSSLKHLRTSKRIAGRAQDIADLQVLDG